MNIDIFSDNTADKHHDAGVGDGPTRLAIIGATGSIGRQTVDIVRENPDLYSASVIAAGSRVDDLIEICKELRPRMAVIADESKFARLREALSPLGIEVGTGAACLADAVTRGDVDMVLTATVGYSGLEPTIRAILAGKDIALANKETLVVAGELINSLLAGSKSRIYPVDSEHSAIYQCLEGEDRESVRRLIITASGGPFRTLSHEELRHVTVDDALRHPNWDMGAKITIDSATMLNKAFEIIEARWLFDIEPERITAVVHPQSIVHSMVEFVDGAIKAQLGVPDMHLPIAYALGRAKRMPSRREALSLSQYASLTFEEPDVRKFPCLSLAQHALRAGGNTACVVNAANEIAVAAFLQRRIGFLDIYRVIAETLENIGHIDKPTYEDYVHTNDLARKYASKLIDKI